MLSSAPFMPRPSSAIASRTSPFRRESSIETCRPPCSSAFPSSSLKTSASAVARCPARSTVCSSRGHLLARDETLDEHRAQPLEQLGQVDGILPVLRQHLVHRGDGEDPVDRVSERLARIDALGARLQPEQRRDGLEVVLDAVVDLLGQDAAQRHAAVLERDGRVVGDRLQQRPVVVA